MTPLSSRAETRCWQDEDLLRDCVDLPHALIVIHDRNSSLANPQRNGASWKKNNKNRQIKNLEKTIGVLTFVNDWHLAGLFQTRLFSFPGCNTDPAPCFTGLADLTTVEFTARGIVLKLSKNTPHHSSLESSLKDSATYRILREQMMLLAVEWQIYAGANKLF